MRDLHIPSWTDAQRAQLAAALDAGEAVAYVCTDAWGGPANGGGGTRCEVGAVQTLGAGRTELCGRGALHGTMHPHRWAGARVWVAIFRDDVQRESDKLGARTRVIVGELLPADVIDASAAARMGLAGADLAGANLAGAYLAGAYLAGANLARANLAGAYLAGADLAGADLARADLARADLARANLAGAYLAGAYLAGANLARANLARANLAGAYLAGAYLAGANLARANLAGAYLAGAYCPCPPPALAPTWRPDGDGYLRRVEESDHG